MARGVRFLLGFRQYPFLKKNGPGIPVFGCYKDVYWYRLFNGPRRPCYTIVIIYQYLEVCFMSNEKKSIFRSRSSSSRYTISSMIVACETRLSENVMPPELYLLRLWGLPGILEGSLHSRQSLWYWWQITLRQLEKRTSSRATDVI